jgi:bacterioferritin
MGTQARKSIKMDVEEVIAMLNKALADEWLAVYQYWAGAKIAKGPMRVAVVPELEEHMADELKHANILAERIVQLGGIPILHPSNLMKFAGCAYAEPTNPNTIELLKQNIKGEQCAIQYYYEIMDKVRGKDPVTHNTILEILKDELEHEHDLQAFLEDQGDCDSDCDCDCGCK